MLVICPLVLGITELEGAEFTSAEDAGSGSVSLGVKNCRMTPESSMEWNSSDEW